MLDILKGKNNIYHNILGIREELLENEHITSTMGDF